MTRIDTSKWGKFRVGDLFAIYLGDYNNPKFLTEDENGIPLVSATTINNGISGYYKKTPDLKVITKNKITWGKQCPYFCYQTTDFITGQGTYYLDVSTLSFYTNLFICAVLNNEISQRYDYNNCLIGKKLSEEIILLPITTKGSPDWQFMEDCMKEITKLAAKRVEKLKEEKTKHKINTKGWKEFRIGDLFETFHGERLKKSDRIEGSTPFVTAGSENQGVADYIVAEKKYSNAITIDMFGNCLYHNGILFGDDNIYFLISSNISKYSKLFITTIFNSTLKEKYSFSHQFRQKDLDTLTINLPSAPDNFPDWQYMEDYMKNVMEQAKKKFSNIPQ